MNVIYSQIEDEIVTRLSPMTTGGGVDVVQLPETPAEFEKPLLAGRVTVAYKSSTYGDIRSLGCITQDEKIQFEIIVQSRLLRTSNGIHTMIEAVKRLVVGFQPTDCSKIYLVQNGYMSRDNDSALWNYSMVFETKYLLVEDIETEENSEGPFLSDITFIYNVNDTEIVEIPGTCEPVNIFNSDSSFFETIVSGGTLELPDDSFNIYVNGVLDQSFTIPSIQGLTVNISA